MSVDAEEPIEEEEELDTHRRYETHAEEPDAEEPDVEEPDAEEPDVEEPNESDIEQELNDSATYALAASTIPREESIKRNKKFANKEKEAAIAKKNAAVVEEINNTTTIRNVSWREHQKKK